MKAVILNNLMSSDEEGPDRAGSISGSRIISEKGSLPLMPCILKYAPQAAREFHSKLNNEVTVHAAMSQPRTFDFSIETDHYLYNMHAVMQHFNFPVLGKRMMDLILCR